MPTAIAIRQVPGKPGSVYYPLTTTTLPTPSPSPSEVVVTLSAAALNHRDLFIRQHLYPGTAFHIPLLADGCGVVTSTGSAPAARAWLGKRVVLNPGEGWAADPDGPESTAGYRILGGTRLNEKGTLGEVIVVGAGEVEEAPRHLDDVQAAALPLTGLTAWRAVVTKSGNAVAGRNLLVTGIGGGVALMALLFASQLGARVWVTSGSEEKIQRARELGAAGGVSYKSKDWSKQLKAMLPADRPFLDAVIDGAGGDIVGQSTRLLKAGGVIVSYGMTLGPQIPYLMGAVLRNIDVRGSTMGSRREFKEMVEFVRAKRLTPVISRVVDGLDIEKVDGLFEDIKEGRQFGKLVVRISKNSAAASRL